MKNIIPINTTRLGVVDALRGFALLAIVLLHNLEHYNLYFIPQDVPSWLQNLDLWIWDTTFFLMAGKAYATFSLLFGFSFFIQMNNEQKRGFDFRWRFVWRLFILIIFSQIHAIYYNGDILLLYAVVGLTLIPVCRLSDKKVFIIAVILLLQPFDLGRMIYSFINPDYSFCSNYFMKYALQVKPVMVDGSFTELVKANIFNGQLYSNIWQIENGRLFQTASLFMFGMLLGRRNYFSKSSDSILFWKKCILISLIFIVPLFVLKTYIPNLIDNQSAKISFNIIIPSLFNFCFMSILVSLFTLLWFRCNGYKVQRLLIPYGRMSLTNYLTQSLIGVVVYYGFGLGLYKYTGATFTILIAFGIFFIQLAFSRWWLNRHKQGPLEYLWRKATWINRKTV